MVISDGIVVIGVVCVCTAMLGDVGDSTTGNGFVEIGRFNDLLLVCLSVFSVFYHVSTGGGIIMTETIIVVLIVLWSIWVTLRRFFSAFVAQQQQRLANNAHDKAGQTCQKY